MSMPRPLAGRTALAAAASLLLAGGLSGCGVAGTDFHPGVAAQVGDETISVSKVDSVVTSYCSAIEGQLQGQNQVLPLRYLRGGVAGELLLVEAARTFAAEKGIEAGHDYDQKVAQLQDAVTSLPEDQQDAVVELESASAYISSVETVAGKQALRDQGRPAHASDALAVGRQEFSSWLDDQDVSVDPQFGIEIKDAQAVPADTSVSYALGDTARAGDARTPDQQYAATLPDAHRCG